MYSCWSKTTSSKTTRKLSLTSDGKDSLRWLVRCISFSMGTIFQGMSALFLAWTKVPLPNGLSQYSWLLSSTMDFWNTWIVLWERKQPVSLLSLMLEKWRRWGAQRYVTLVVGRWGKSYLGHGSTSKEMYTQIPVPLWPLLKVSKELANYWRRTLFNPSIN